jgi:hypothetical protein
LYESSTLVIRIKDEEKIECLVLED